MNSDQNKKITLNEDITQFEIEDFLSVGSESLVFIAKKKNVGRTYALKFRAIQDDKNGVNHYENFIGQDSKGEVFKGEIDFYKELEKCSVSKLAGIISEVPSDTFYEVCQIYNQKKSPNSREISPKQTQFCVIEDYIQGCTLAEYLKEHAPGKNASYQQILDYQEQIFNWIIQFCEIMENFTIEEKIGEETIQKRILHLDIKPQNIMVTDQTKSLVLIDFNLSQETDQADETGIYHNSEWLKNTLYVGTLYYAAPEAYFDLAYKPPFDHENYGFRLDDRSDIFSFGATLWVCLHPDRTFSIPLTEEGYYKRDLYDVPVGYSQELENIIVKCTQKDPSKRYQSFEELRKAAEKSKRKLPTEHKQKVNSILGAVFITLSVIAFICGICSMLLQFKSHDLIYDAKRKAFDSMAAMYTESRFNDYKTCASELIEADPSNTQSYIDILKVAYTDRTIKKAENADADADAVSLKEFVEILLPNLRNTDDPEIIKLYANRIVSRAVDSNIPRIAEMICASDIFNQHKECPGFELSKALYECGTDPIESYNTLKKYSNNENEKVIYQKIRKSISKRLTGNLVALERIEKADANAKEFLESVDREKVLRNYEFEHYELD